MHILITNGGNSYGPAPLYQFNKFIAILKSFQRHNDFLCIKKPWKNYESILWMSVFKEMGLYTLFVGLSRLCSQTQCVVKINDQMLTLLLFLIFHTIYKICLCVEETTQYQLWHHIKHIRFCWFLSCRCHCFESENKMRRMLPLSNFLSIWFAFIGCVNCARWVLNFQLHKSYLFSVKKQKEFRIWEE